MRCPTGKTPKPSVNPYRHKYSTLPKFGNGVCVVPLRPKEGYGMPESDSPEFMDVIQGLSTCLGRRACDVFW
ncbi:hypothetical protein ABID58_002098, partial [Bradyrhizobium sp. S3.2.6]